MSKKNKKLSKPLTWSDLADEYDKITSKTARILPMTSVFEWAEKQKDKFKVSKKGTIHKRL